MGCLPERFAAFCGPDRQRAYCTLIALLLATEREGQQARGDIDDWNHAVVCHPRGSDHPQRTHDLPVHLIGRCHHAHFLNRYEIRLAAYEYLHALRVARYVE